MSAEADRWHRHGAGLFARGDIAEAMAALRQALAYDDTRADIHADLGVIAHRAGDLVTAESHLRRALALSAEVPGIHYNLANLLRDRGELNEAVDLYRAAIARTPAFVPAYNNLGNVLKSLKRADEAATAYHGAIAADPKSALVHRNLADLDEARGETAAALAGFGRAKALRDDAGTRIRDAFVLPVIPESAAQIEDFRARMGERLAALEDAELSLGNPLIEIGATPFYLAYHGQNDRPLMEALARIYRKACPSLSFVAPHCEEGPRSTGELLRIGFVSNFLGDHTIGRLNERLIAGLPRDRFDVEVFNRLPTDLDAARQTIAETKLDLLYFPDIGMEPLSYFLAFARLAPIQCVSWGHPVTSGISTIDYFVSSQLIEPENAQDVYSERLVELAAMPASTSALDLPTGCRDGPVFLCPQSLFKFHPDFDAVIGRILGQCPNAELGVLSGTYPQWEEALTGRWRRTIPEVVDRIRFVPRRDRAGFIELLASARVILDPLHFCGGLTSFEALVAGTPVVTLPSAFMRGRVTLGLYRRMGMDALVAESIEQYVDLAVRLARDEAFYRKVKADIRTLAPRLIDDPAPIDEHAAFFEKTIYGAA